MKVSLRKIDEVDLYEIDFKHNLINDLVRVIEKTIQQIVSKEEIKTKKLTNELKKLNPDDVVANLDKYKKLLS